MKKIILLIMLLVICLFAGVVFAAEPGGQSAGGAYNPTVVYSGDQIPDILMVRNSAKAAWRRVPKLDRLRYITCQDALGNLNREGKWQGHLNPDGSCGPTAEPSDWVLGNRLNYEDALDQAGK